MGNYRTQLKGIGCAELLANSLKSKAPEDAFPSGIPTGETSDNLEDERLHFMSLLTE